MDLFTRTILTVSQLTGEIKDLLERSHHDVWVEGEISNLRQPPSGHFYFTLKDEQSQIRAVLFKLQARYLRFALADGTQVICWGRVGVYEKRGEYQLILDYVEPKGLGSLQLALQQLKERLTQEGLFDERRKRPLPLVPRCIGIVTSPAGAAIRDILNILRRRFENIEILLYPVKVQGAGAAEEIAQGIETLGRMGAVDIIIVGRGGGSLEDLWPFNEEIVARAIFASPVPVVSAVGHETDFTIADFVADLRAPTPSAAAEIVVREKRDLIRTIGELRARLERELAHLLRRRQEEIDHTTQRLKDPRRRTQELRVRLDDCWDRLVAAAARTCSEKIERVGRIQQLLLGHSPRREITALKERTGHMGRQMASGMLNLLALRRRAWETETGRLSALSPLGILERGYSITRRLPDGQVLRDSSEVARGSSVEVRLHQGVLICRVDETG